MGHQKFTEQPIFDPEKKLKKQVEKSMGNMYSGIGEFSTHYYEPINRVVGSVSEMDKNAQSVVAIEIG
jgi:uncharacterized protein (UPF0297 family)